MFIPSLSTMSLASARAATVLFKATPYTLHPVRCLSSRIHREKPKDLYATLEVSPSATQQQLKDAYYKLSMKYHPDRNEGSQEAHQKFTSLTEAYSVLGQYELRKKYDKGLLQHSGKAFSADHHTEVTQTKKSTQFMNKDKVKYNFDEFYKAHYGRALEREREKKRKSAQDKADAELYKLPPSINQAIIMSVALFVVISTTILAPAN